MTRRIITLTLSMPTDTPPNEPNGFQRLRKLLKCLLRVYGLRCVDIREQQTPPETPTDAPLATVATVATVAVSAPLPIDAPLPFSGSLHIGPPAPGWFHGR